MKNIKSDLWALQGLHGRLGISSGEEHSETEGLRKRIPSSVLVRFDQMLSRGKRPVAIVRRGVCTECHLRVTKADLMALVSMDEPQLCGNCGRYLYLPEEEAISMLPAAPVSEPPVRRGRRRQAVAA